MLVRKTYTSSSGGPDFILSDATVDRYGDSIDPNGWDIRNFLRNPIALFGHQGGFPIGTWKNVQVKDGALCGRLMMAAKGTSPRIDELRALLDAGILKSVSVGFSPIESEPLVKSGGTRYIKSELIEVSLVSVPANPNAVQISKALGVSEETMQMVFKRNDNTGRLVTVNMNATISERIEKAKRAVASLEKAKATLERLKALDQLDRTEKARASQVKNSKAREERDRIEKARYSLGITWRGQKIPDGWFYSGRRKNFWDENS
jgi:HK97 family phage prohead protease